MSRYLLTKVYTGIVDVRKDNNSLEICYPDGTSENIFFNDKRYDRYFDTIGTLLGYVSNIDGQSMLMIAPYVSLHNHSEYSVLDGLSKASDIAKKLNGDDAVYSPFFALTDHGIPSGLPSFDAKMSKAYLCPINGMEFYAEDFDGAEKRASGSKPNMNHHLILIAKNDVGYKNLSHLVTDAQHNFYYHANVTVEMLRKHREGLICMSACIGGELPQYLLAGNHEKAEKFIEIYKDIFGDDFYLEVQNHGILDEIKAAQELFKLGEKYGIKVVATSDSHYINAEDSYTHEVLLAIGTKKKMDDPDRMRFDGSGYHVLNADEFYDLYPAHPEVISNAFEIVRKCQYHFKQRKIEMPDFDVPEGYTISTYFDHVAKQGFEERFKGTPQLTSQEYLDRLEYELSIIHQMEFEGYFLIVQDFIREARRRGVAVGPGRGSAVGSLVAYCLTITNLDPIPYGLLFERFLNPERVSMPDIDIDFSDERRHEVIEYVNEKYGKDHVSRIVAFGTEAAKADIKDVGRVFNMPPADTQKVVDCIPAEPKMTIDKAMSGSLEFKEMYDTDPKVKEIVDIAKRIEGCVRNIAMHACGVVIAKNPVADNIPEILVEDDFGEKIYSTSFNKEEVEENGCIKFDFLGLRNMSILQNACKSINMEIDDIPLFDPKVYAYIATGNTDGIFQIESDGMKALMRDMFYDVENRIKDCKTQKELDDLGFECFERLIAAISLYRPGPLDYIPDYVAGMRDPNNIHYDCPELKPILATTYGTICYQEQVQQICRDLAGYSLGRADLIRRGMAKKKQYIIDAEKEIFLNGNKKAFDSGKDNAYVPGCINNGISPEAANIIWAKMEKFAEYA